MRPAATVLALLVALAGLAAPALAHAEIRERAPAAGQVLGGDVDHIDISFAGPIERAEIVLLGPDGERIDIGETEVRRNGLIVTAEFDPITEPGLYTVAHRELAADGDEQSDAYGFEYDPDSEGRLESLFERDTGPNWLVLGAIGAVVLVALVAFMPRRRG